MESRNNSNQKKYLVEITESYFIQLKTIIWYIAKEQNQPLNAIKISEGIQVILDKIIENPLLFSKCEKINTKSIIYREARYKTWLIIYKFIDNKITILGILSGKKNPKFFKEFIK